MQQLRGEMGVQAAKRRKVNLASREAAAKTAEGRRAFDQILADEECPNSELELDCFSFLFANITRWGARRSAFVAILARADQGLS